MLIIVLGNGGVAKSKKYAFMKLILRKIIEEKKIGCAGGL